MARTHVVFMAALALGASLAQAQPIARGEAVVYERADFRGRNVTVRGDMANFEFAGFNDRAASLYIVSGTWELCTEAYFRGSCRIYEPGQYKNLGNQALRVSSARLVTPPPQGWTGGNPMQPAPERWMDVGKGDVSLFDGRNFVGFLATLNEPMRDFARIGINDRVASIIVNRGTWEFCTDAQFRGTCRLYGPGEYRQLPSGQDDAYSSARPASAAASRVENPVARPPGPDRWGAGRPRAILFDSQDFHGRSLWVDATTPNLELIGFNDRAQSLIVEGGTWRMCSDAAGGGNCHEFGPGRYPILPRDLQSRLSSAQLR
jgi:hypothetical protein